MAGNPRSTQVTVNMQAMFNVVEEYSVFREVEIAYYWHLHTLSIWSLHLKLGLWSTKKKFNNRGAH